MNKEKLSLAKISLLQCISDSKLFSSSVSKLVKSRLSRSQRQEDLHDLQVILVYMVSSRLLKATKWESVPKQNKIEKKKEKKTTWMQEKGGCCSFEKGLQLPCKSVL